MLLREPCLETFCSSYRGVSSCGLRLPPEAVVENLLALGLRSRPTSPIVTWQQQQVGCNHLAAEGGGEIKSCTLTFDPVPFRVRAVKLKTLFIPGYLCGLHSFHPCVSG